MPELAIDIPRKQTGLIRRLTRTLASPKLAVISMCAIALVSIIGTVLPQGGLSEKSLRLAQQKYGPHLHQLFQALGFYDLYRSWWFISLLCLFALNNLACLATRGRLRLKSLGFFVTHVSVAAIACGVVVGAVWGEKGFVRLGEKQTIDQFRTRDGRTVKLRFKLRLEDFTVERHGERTEALRVKVNGKDSEVDFPVKVGSLFHVGGTDYDLRILRYVPDFFIDLKTREARTRSEEPNNPALQVEIDKDGTKRKTWVFAKFPGQNFDKHKDTALKLFYVRGQAGPVKDYKSDLTVLEGDQEAARKTIVVNDPLTYGGYTFYQSSYDRENLRWSGLQVTKDPGVPVVYAGFGLMIVGIVFVFYVKPFLGQKRTKP